MTSRDEVAQQTGRIVVAGGSTVSRTLHLALSRLEDSGPLMPGAGDIELIAPELRRRPLLSSAVNELERELATRYPDTTIVSRPKGRLFANDLRGWLRIPAPEGTERFNEILVPAWWTRGSRRCLVTAVPRRTTVARLSPMFVLADLAHPRQRLAARLHRNRDGLAAELAAPWRVDLCLIVASRPPLRVVAATQDLIAAELAWLALSAHEDALEDVGPWEEEAVQRATELGIGVLGPHQVSISAVTETLKPGMSEQLAARLGVSAAR